MITTLIVGDQHFKIDNIPLINKFAQKIIDIIQNKNPDFVVLLGDMLHTHERLHTTVLNKAYEFIDSIRKLCMVYILVGNHDSINGTQFLTTNHWMNGLKEWDNVLIVDTVIEISMNEEKFIFCPYVPAGRFEDALNTIENWENATCIFAHQEFYGCKMGGILSVEGDKWSLNYPNIISGHIHDNQLLQENIYYPGSSLEISYGQNKQNIVAYVQFPKNENYILEEINLEMPLKKLVYLDIENIDDFNMSGTTEDEITLSLNGDYTEFKSLKKTKKYKELIKKGVKVIFKPKKKNIKIKNEKLSKIINDNTEDLTNFSKIINEIINEQEDPYLLEVFEIVVNNNKINSDDILFL